MTSQNVTKAGSYSLKNGNSFDIVKLLGSPKKMTGGVNQMWILEKRIPFRYVSLYITDGVIWF
jgi:hypothetical protein